jgi:hypothetical protein
VTGVQTCALPIYYGHHRLTNNTECLAEESELGNIATTNFH